MNQWVDSEIKPIVEAAQNADVTSTVIAPRRPCFSSCFIVSSYVIADGHSRRGSQENQLGLEKRCCPKAGGAEEANGARHH